VPTDSDRSEVLLCSRTVSQRCSAESIFTFEEYSYLTSGFIDPLTTIPRCNTQPPTLRPSPAKAHDATSPHENSKLHSSLQTSSWDQTLSFSSVGSIGTSIESTSTPFPSSSLAPLSGDLLFESHAPFLDTLDWNAFSSLQTTDANTFPIDGAPFITSTEELAHILTPPTDAQNVHDLSLSQYLDQDHLPNSGSSPESPRNRSSSSSERSSSTSKLSSTKSRALPNDSARVEKRKQNTLAARRYRQKRVDQMSTLESELKETQSERDALKVRVARLEGEVETLRALLRPQS